MNYRFNACELDLRHHEFRRDGEIIALEPQVFDLLKLFVLNPDDLLSRDRIIDEVWNGRIVSEAAISSRINAVRRAIGDDGRTQAMLRTVPRRGFRFVAPITLVDGPQPDLAPSPTGHQAINMTLSRDGSRIAYAITGHGAPLLRAGHFLTHLEQDWNSPIWRPLLDRLGAHFSVVRYDQRSTGLSDPAPPSLGLDRLVEDMEAVADAAGLERFPIFAASQGVPVAISFCAKHPDRVSKLVLYGGFAQGRNRRGTPEDRQQASAVQTFIREGWGRSGTAFATAFATLYMPDATREQLQHMTQMQLASATPQNALALRNAIDNFDVSDLLDQIGVPTLVLHAREDSVHPSAQSGVLAAGIRGAQLHVMESRNHVPLPQDPCWTEMLEAITRFLE